MSILAKDIKANNKTLNLFLINNKLFRGSWYIKDSLLSEKDISAILDNHSTEYNKLMEEIKSKTYIKQVIFVFNSETKKFIRKYDEIMIAEKELRLRHEKIKDSIIKNKPLNGYIFSYHRLINGFN